MDDASVRAGPVLGLDRRGTSPNGWNKFIPHDPDVAGRARDRYGDVYVDGRRSTEVYREWLAKARATLGPGGQRRPEFLMRPVKPVRRAFRVPE